MREALAHLKKADPVLGELIGRLGPYRIQYSPPDFATLARCIVYQQLSGKVAVTIYRRLESLAPKGRALTPDTVMRLKAEAMRSAGLSQQKIDYLRELARACLQGDVDLDALRRLPDGEVMRRLTRLKGIGPWTVQMYLIFALRRRDVLPAGDLGIRAAVRNIYGLAARPSPAEVERLGRPWRPYATVASWYLWRSLGDGAGL